MLSQVEVSSTRWFVFQGTPDDARTLLIAISSTLATVIALVLGLTVVALQLASTQFSPRLLRNFLRDRTNQVVLSVFVATFTYSTAGLFTVGVSAGQRVEDYPRLAVSFALALLFVSLLMLVFFVHHLAHSIQIDEVMRSVERSTLRVIEHDLPSQGVSAEPAPSPPAWAVAVPAYQSGWVQTMRPDVLLPLAGDHDLVAVVSTMVGEFVVEGAPLLWVWAPSADDPPPDPATFGEALPVAVRLGYERTAEQDVAFGVRQLADIAVKALSPAINDPYTSIQALEHLGVLLATWCAGRSAANASTTMPARPESSCPAGTCPTTSTWPPARSAGTGAPSRGSTGPCCGCSPPPAPSVTTLTTVRSSPDTCSSSSKTPSGPSPNRPIWSRSARTLPASSVSSTSGRDGARRRPDAVAPPPRDTQPATAATASRSSATARLLLGSTGAARPT